MRLNKPWFFLLLLYLENKIRRYCWSFYISVVKMKLFLKNVQTLWMNTEDPEHWRPETTSRSAQKTARVLWDGISNHDRKQRNKRDSPYWPHATRWVVWNERNKNIFQSTDPMRSLDLIRVLVNNRSVFCWVWIFSSLASPLSSDFFFFSPY